MSVNGNACAICTGTMIDNKCRACGWEDRGTVNIKMDHFWLFIHMSWMLLTIICIGGIV